MTCTCCGRKKKILESFENIGSGGDICVDCSDILYRIHDAYTEENRDEYDRNVESVLKFKEKKSSAEFTKWFEQDFMKRNKL